MRHLLQRIGVLTSVPVLVVGLAGCGDSNVETLDRGQVATSKTEPSPHPQTDPADGPTAAVAGISWSVPLEWMPGPERPMRIATYWVGSGSNRADCAVFFFGPGQGGTVEENINRWIGQFTQTDGGDSRDRAAINKETVAEFQVTTIDLSGTYTASMGGPMSSQKEDRSDYRMLGAIVEAPQGPVFFKLTGPTHVVTAALDEFNQLVQSVKKT
jgi:hypothetical protein